MNYIISKFKNNIDLLSILIILLPISIIIGNLAVNLSCLLIIILGVKKFNQEFIEYLNLFKFYLVVLFVFFILNIVFSSDYLLSLKGTIGTIKHILLSLIIFFWLISNKNNLFIFLVSIFFCVVLVATSIYIEFLIKLFYLHVMWDGVFPVDGYGLKNGVRHLTFNRFSGIFFEEKVAGSFIEKLLCPILLFLLINTKKFKKDKFLYAIVIFCYFAVLMSLDRSPFIIISFGLFVFLFFTKKISLSNKFNLLFVSLTIVIVSYNTIFPIQSKFNYTLKQFGIIDEKNSEVAWKRNKNFLETKWASHFITAYEMGKKSFIIGNGIKTFRKDCGKYEFLSEKFDQGPASKRCSTHPHNIYFELFAETGTFGLLIFIYFHFMVLKKIYENKNRELKIILFSIFIVLFFPIQTTGSYFSTFNGIFYFLNLSIINFICFNKKISV
jgi:O-antigen ligase